MRLSNEVTTTAKKDFIMLKNKQLENFVSIDFVTLFFAENISLCRKNLYLSVISILRHKQKVSTGKKTG